MHSGYWFLYLKDLSTFQVISIRLFRSKSSNVIELLYNIFDLLTFGWADCAASFVGPKIGPWVAPDHTGQNPDRFSLYALKQTQDLRDRVVGLVT